MKVRSTYYVNDVNRQNTQQFMTYDDEGNLKDAYVYGNNDERLTRDHIQNDNPTESGHRALDTYLYDGRGSVSQVTNEQSIIVGNQQYRYDPFGNMIQNKPDKDIIFGYNGEEYNPTTDTQYLRARYYDVGMGRFISKDTYLGNVKDPESRNLYAYTQNDPVNYQDPSGNKVWLIHGTFSRPNTWTSSFKTYVGKLFGETVATPKWTGSNNDAARQKAAKDIEKDIVAFHKKYPKNNIRLVGHSHGGNVAILVVNRLAKDKIKVRTLITIATPVREYQLKTSVGQHINVYNNLDQVQIDLAQLDTRVIKAYHPIETRKFVNAVNIEVTLPKARIKTPPNSIIFKGNDAFHEQGPIQAHSAMHSNVAIWKKYIAPKIRK